MSSKISVRALSHAWERATGADSIDTIERVYNRTDGGAYECCFPGCSFTRKDPEAMWRHIHGGSHGENFPESFPPADFDAGMWL